MCRGDRFIVSRGQWAQGSMEGREGNGSVGLTGEVDGSMSGIGGAEVGNCMEMMGFGEAPKHRVCWVWMVWCSCFSVDMV